MNSRVIEYKIDQAEATDIAVHLTDCKDSFYPPLDHRVDINEYAEKIFHKAVTFEAWHGNRLIGLVAAYCNETENKAYITTVSVIHILNDKGIASNLLEFCIKYIERLQLGEILLRVNVQSNKARKLYEKYGFKEIELKNEFVLMRRMK
jgi:ribosomal protein S18 acetylase RimI-like enzyme